MGEMKRTPWKAGSAIVRVDVADQVPVSHFQVCCAVSLSNVLFTYYIHLLAFTCRYIY